MKKILISCFLICYLTLTLIDTMPRSSLLHGIMKEKIDIILDKTALWQGSWTLFSPTPDNTNVYISWRCILSDGYILEGRSPDWSQMGLFQKWRFFRHMEFYDNIRMDSNRGAWPSFARYLKQDCQNKVNTLMENENIQPQKLKVYRHWATIPSYSPQNAKMIPRPYTHFNNRFLFIEESF